MSTDLTSITKKYFYKNNKFEEMISILTESKTNCFGYNMYGLKDNNIKEVDTWYARRYPKMTGFAEID